jgi:3-methyladenine DNA glycosylase AlkD
MMATYTLNELNKILSEQLPMGQIKKLAKEIKKNHELSLELWKTENYQARLLAVLLLDKKLLSQEVLETFVEDLSVHSQDEQNRITEWLMANQLMKGKRTTELLLSWQHHKLPTFRRLFWYHQARLRWTGQASPENTAALVKAIKQELANEHEIVQWTMNFCAAWIGLYNEAYRDELIQLGETVGLYKEEKAPKNCTPNYLPDFIKVELNKRK